MRIVSWIPPEPSQAAEALMAYVTAHDPEIVALHQTDVFGADFPLVELYELGFYAKIHGRHEGHGVGLISPEPPRDVRRDPEGNEGTAHVLSGTVAGLRIVVGSGDEQALREHIRRNVAPHESVLVVDAGVSALDGFVSVGEDSPFAVRGALRKRCVDHGEVDGQRVMEVRGGTTLEVPDRNAPESKNPWHG